MTSKSLALLVSLLMINAASAEQLRIAVASNFSPTMKLLVEDFTETSKHQVSISSASTGKLFAQIVNGAPYDLFFSADEQRADLLKKRKLADKTMVYARGQLMFVARGVKPSLCRRALDNPSINKLALANPKTAPYGLAAKQVLLRLGKWDQLRTKLVMGENILQTYQFIATGSADAGFIAASIAHHSVELDDFCQWTVPQNLYAAVRQKMAWLNRARKNLAAKAFFDYMSSEKADTIIKDNGYRLK